MFPVVEAIIKQFVEGLADDWIDVSFGRATLSGAFSKRVPSSPYGVEAKASHSESEPLCDSKKPLK